jgi:transposase-like protein
MNRQRRRFTAEQKAEAVGLCLSEHLSHRCSLGIGNLGSSLSSLLFCGAGLLLAAAASASSSALALRRASSRSWRSSNSLGSSSPCLPLP